jgi:hypothetical protein
MHSKIHVMQAHLDSSEGAQLPGELVDLELRALLSLREFPVEVVTNAGVRTQLILCCHVIKGAFAV